MPSSPRAAKIDPLCEAAVARAREAALEAAGVMGVGDHLGCRAEGDRVASHLFACPHPGYRGWQWSVTVARASRAKAVTVNEVVLLPGQGALMASSWLPWTERVVVKQADGTHSAASVHPSVARERIATGAEVAVRRAGDGAMSVLEVERPVTIEVDYAKGVRADFGAIVPGAERLGDRMVRYASDDPVDAYRAFLAINRLASATA